MVKRRDSDAPVGESRRGRDFERGDVLWSSPNDAGGFGANARDPEHRDVERPFLLAETPERLSRPARAYPGSSAPPIFDSVLAFKCTQAMAEPLRALTATTYFRVGSLIADEPDGLNNYRLKVVDAARGRNQSERPWLNELGITELVRIENELAARMDMLKEQDERRT